MANVMTQPTPAAEVQVGEHTYRIYMLDATRGYPLYCKLLGQVGGVLEAGGKLDSQGKELALRLLGRAIQSLTPELVGELIKAFGSSSQLVTNGGAQPVQAVFATHFAGKYGDMMGWLYECAKVNFESFLPPNLTALIGAEGFDPATIARSLFQPTSKTGS
jgi:hypothetical protein